jgi:toxin-antitoxin system PIN domain toxin
MILTDVNILLNAFRADTPHHQICRSCLEGLLDGPSAFGFSPTVISGFLRIVTHPKVFTQPSPMEEALAFCEALQSAPQAQVLNPGERHWEIFSTLCQQANARGNLVPDA